MDARIKVGEYDPDNSYEWTPSTHKFKHGDRLNMSVPVYRRWWQFWKPRVIGRERRTFTITGASPKE